MTDIDLIKAAGISAPKPSEGPDICLELAYIVSRQSYLIRGLTGSWDFENPIGREAARIHLLTLGYGPKKAGSVLQKGQHLRAHGIRFDPRQGTEIHEEDRLYLNTYQKPAVIPVAGDFSTIRYIIETVTAGDAVGAEWLMNWFACIYQNPGYQTKGAVVACAGTGTGKSLLGNLFIELLGRGNCAEVGQDAIESQFNSQFADKIFVLADEVVNSDNRVSAKNKLKRYISDPHIDINRKGVAQFSVPNRMNWYFTSNDLVPVKFSGKDDRHYPGVFSNHLAGRAIPGHSERLAKLFSNSGYSSLGRREMAAWAHELKSRRVDFGRVTELNLNEAREDLANDSRNSAEMFIDKVQANGIDALILPWLGDVGPMMTKNGPMAWSFEDGGEVASQAVWGSYQRFCKECGYYQLGRNTFYRHLKKVWKKVEERTFNGSYRPPSFIGMPRSGKASLTLHVGKTPTPDAQAKSISESPNDQSLASGKPTYTP